MEPYRVAIVDDDPNIRFLIDRYLRNENFMTFPCSTGTEAYELLHRQTVDAWVLDIMLPGIDGYELCRRIRKHAPVEVPILMISARDDEVDRILGIETGGDDYLTKPFSPRELVARLTRSLHRMERLVGPQIPAPSNDLGNLPAGNAIPGLRVATHGHRVFWQGTEYELTPKEFQLLQHLHQNANISFSREELLNAVWGQDYFGSDRTVDHVVKRIRKKIPGLPVANVWGYGYRLDVTEGTI